MYASSILILFLILQGLPASAFLWRAVSAHNSYRAILAVVLFPLLIGTTQDLVLVLAFRDIRLSFYAGIFIAVCGLPVCFWHREALQSIMSSFWAAKSRKSFSTAALILGVLIVLVLLLSELYYSPIEDWDARSIWFFQGKILFFDGGFKETSWTLPTISFSHPDYPKAVPILAAQIASINGYWNEYDPLTSIAIILVIEVMLLAYVLETPIELMIFTAPVGLSMGMHPFVNGYMDAHIGTMSSLAAMCLLRRSKETGMTDLYLGALTLGLVASMKNEGLVLSFLVLTVCSLANSQLRQAIFLVISRKSLFIVMIAALPSLLWMNLKLQWGLVNDLSKNGQLERLLARINMHDLALILGLSKVLLIFLAVGILAVANRFINRNRASAAATLVVCAAIYYGVLIVVYLTTPYDLNWHLSTAGRVVYPIYMMLICSTVLYFRSWTSSQDCVRDRRAVGDIR